MKYLFVVAYLIVLVGCIFYGVKDKEILGCLIGFVMILGIFPFLCK